MRGINLLLYVVVLFIVLHEQHTAGILLSHDVVVNIFRLGRHLGYFIHMNRVQNQFDFHSIPLNLCVSALTFH